MLPSLSRFDHLAQWRFLSQRMISEVVRVQISSSVGLREGRLPSRSLRLLWRHMSAQAVLRLRRTADRYGLVRKTQAQTDRVENFYSRVVVNPTEQIRASHGFRNQQDEPA